eukprot:gene36032-40748_t
MIAVVTSPKSGVEPSDNAAMPVEAGVQNNQMPEPRPARAQATHDKIPGETEDQTMAPRGSQRTVNKIVAENRKARFNYEIVDTYEAGLVLTGTEVKSLREGKANIAESYASDEGEEIWLINSH